MADNATSGQVTTFSTDQLPSGAHVPHQKIMDGTPDGTLAAKVTAADPVENDAGLVVRSIAREPKSFYAVFDRIVPAANKYMATIFNTLSTRKIVVQTIWMANWQVAAVTGVMLEQYLAFITSRAAAGATAVPAWAYDSNDTLTAGVVVETNSQTVVERNVMDRFFAVSEEAALAATALPMGLANDKNFMLIYERKDGMRGLTLRQNQGIAVRNVTASAVGSVSYIIEFTDEVA